LEVELGGGFAPALPRLKTAGNLILVVREDLLPVVTPYVPEHIHRIFHVAAGAVDETGKAIHEFLESTQVSS